jgi:uncharacterized membrane protein YdjX (TVP38/TMEM64 family)
MSEPQKPVRWWVWLVAGLILVILVAAVIKWWQPLYDLMSDFLPSQEQIASWVESLGIWGPVAIILLEMVQALLAPIPGQAIEAVSGYLYGPWLGTLFPMIGMAIGSFRCPAALGGRWSSNSSAKSRWRNWTISSAGGVRPFSF